MPSVYDLFPDLTGSLEDDAPPVLQAFPNLKYLMEYDQGLHPHAGPSQQRTTWNDDRLQREQAENLAGAQQDLKDSWFPNVKATAMQLGGNVSSMGKRLASAAEFFVNPQSLTDSSWDQAADADLRVSNAYAQAASERDMQQWDSGQSMVPPIVKRGLRGAATTLPTAIVGTAVAGPYGGIALSAGQEGNQAITEGKDAGLKGGDLTAYAASQAAIEGAVASVFQKIGLGGLESTLAGKAVATKGIGQALKQAGVRTLQELPEEIITEVGHNVAKAVSGVDPRATSAQSLQDTISDTTVQTLITMGLAESPQIAQGAQTGLQRQEQYTAAKEERSSRTKATDLLNDADFAATWSAENQEAAAKLAALESPSRSQWAEITGFKVHGTPQHRQAFAENVRGALARRQPAGFEAEPLQDAGVRIDQDAPKPTVAEPTASTTGDITPSPVVQTPTAAPSSLLPPEYAQQSDQELMEFLTVLGDKAPPKNPPKTFRARLEKKVAALIGNVATQPSTPQDVPTAPIVPPEAPTDVTANQPALDEESATPASSVERSAQAGVSSFKADIDAAFAEADAASGGYNFVKVHELRKRLPQYSPDEFNKELRQLRLDSQYTMEASTGATKLTDEEKAAGINDGWQNLVYISRDTNWKESPPVSLTQSPASAGIAAPVLPMPGMRGIQAWLRRYMTSKGNLPQEAFDRAIAKDASIAAEGQEIRNNANDLRDAVRAEAGAGRLTPGGQQKIDAALKGDATALTTLPPKVQEVVGRMRAHIDSLSQRLLDSGIAGEKLEMSIEGNMGSYATRSYKVFDDPDWKSKVPASVRQTAFDHLKGLHPSETDQQINNRIDDMLTRDKAPVAMLKASRLGSKDTGILQRRKDIAPEIRALLGEHTDPYVNYARSVTKMAHLIANQEFLSQMRTEGLGKFFFERDAANRPSGYNAEFASPESDTLSPLNGLMTTPEIKQAFSDVYAKDTPSWFMQQYLRANYLVKYAKTVLSPMTHIRNLTGNVMFAVQNGHWNLGKMVDASKAVTGEAQANAPTLARSVWGTIPEWRKKFQRYTKLGVVGEGVHAQELRAALNDALEMTPQAMAESTVGRAIEMGKEGMKAATTAYQLEDAVWKIYAFENERARYKAAYEKAGQPKTDAELDELAAKIVRDTYPTYSMIPRAVQMLRRAPLVGAFVSFPSEVVRTTYKSVVQAITELNDPATRSIGAQRLAGNLAAMAIPVALTMGARMLLGIGDDEDRDLREFLPEWQQNADILWLSKPENGKAEYIDLSYSMPNSLLRKPVTAMLRGEDTVDSLKQGSWTFAEPFIGEEILAGKLIDIARNTTSNKREVYPEFGSDAAKAEAIGKHLYEAFEPGAATSAKRIIKGYQGTVEKSGRSYDPETELLAMTTGVRFQETDAEQALSFQARAFADAKRKTTGMFSGTMGSKGTVTGDQIGTAYKEAEAAYRGQFNKMHRAAQAAINLGVAEDTVLGTLRAGGLSEEDAKNVIAGKYEPYRMTKPLYEKVQGMPDAAERIEAYEKATGDTSRDDQFRAEEVVQRADVLARTPPLKATERTKWARDRAEATAWLKEQGASQSEVMQAYDKELAKIKTPKLRSAKRGRLQRALGGL